MRIAALLRTLTAGLLFVILLFALFEGVYRVLGYWRNATFQSLHEYDRELAWITTRNYSGAEVTLRDRLGHVYPRSMHTDARGARLWGTRPGASRLLFLGDSVTEAVEVSDAKTYPAVFSRLADFDVYAYGTGAYSTLQEAMMLDRLLTEIRPDVLVLQFSLNDFTNNSHDLERHTVLFQQMIRPYLVDDRIVDGYPEMHPYRLALRYSRLFARLDATWGVALYWYYGDFNRLPVGSERTSLEQAAVETSGRLLRRVAARVPAGTRLYAFNRDESQTASNHEFERIAAAAGYRVITDIAKVADAQESGQVTTLAEDRIHFNDLGNRIVGERLADFFAAQKRESSPPAN